MKLYLKTIVERTIQTSVYETLSLNIEPISTEQLTDKICDNLLTDLEGIIDFSTVELIPAKDLLNQKHEN